MYDFESFNILKRINENDITVVQQIFKQLRFKNFETNNKFINV